MFFTFSYCGKCFFWVLWRSLLFVHEIISARGNSMHMIYARVSHFARSRDAGLRGVLVLNVPRLHWFSCVLLTCTVHCIRLLSACSFLLTPPHVLFRSASQVLQWHSFPVGGCCEAALEAACCHFN